jgi:hypothetical protein
MLSGLDPNTPRLQVEIPCVLTAAQIQGDVVPTDRVQGNRYGGMEILTEPGDVLRLPIPRCHNSRISNSKHVLSVSVIGAPVLRIA